MSELRAGQVVALTNGSTVSVIKELGRGGQGIVYLVNYNGKQAALKWYILDYKDAFYQNIENNVKLGSPSPSFLWPIALTKRQLGSFGYVMDLRPDGYEEIGSFMLAKVRFRNVEALMQAALEICAAFQKLHIKGMSYQDMNDGNFFINPRNGHVLICDNDNVAPDRVNMGIVGKSGYMAPEIVEKESMPNRYTDYFSLAVILFILFYLNRPFEGARVAKCPCLTEEAERMFYGKGCVFIMDPTDDSNRPVRGLHTNVLRRWPLFPKLLRETFIKAFSKEAITTPNKRILDKTWEQVLLQVRSQFIPCPSCGEKTFIDNIDSNTNKCMECGGVIQRPAILKSGNFRIPLVKDQVLYACQTQASMDTDINQRVGVVVENSNTGKLGIKNVSGMLWQVTTPVGETRNVENNSGLPIIDDMKIRFNKDITGLIIK